LSWGNGILSPSDTKKENFVRRVTVLCAATFVSLTGCGPVRTYFSDRGKDLADCVQAHAGIGMLASVNARATEWLATGIGLSVVDGYAYHDRLAGRAHWGHLGFPFPYVGMWYMHRFENSLKSMFKELRKFTLESKSDSTEEGHPRSPEDDPLRKFPFLYYLATDMSDWGWGPLKGSKITEELGWAPLRSDTASFILLNMGSHPSIRRYRRYVSHYILQPTPVIDKFDVDVRATLFPVSLGVGFRPGQFLDFLLGWTTLDIAGDDE
jgi:hypothetical protein